MPTQYLYIFQGLIATTQGLNELMSADNLMAQQYDQKSLYQA